MTIDQKSLKFNVFNFNKLKNVKVLYIPNKQNFFCLWRKKLIEKFNLKEVNKNLKEVNKNLKEVNVISIWKLFWSCTLLTFKSLKGEVMILILKFYGTFKYFIKRNRKGFTKILRVVYFYVLK
jgi:hypothetical protein